MMKVYLSKAKFRNGRRLLVGQNGIAKGLNWDKVWVSFRCSDFNMNVVVTLHMKEVE